MRCKTCDALISGNDGNECSSCSGEIDGAKVDQRVKKVLERMIHLLELDHSFGEEFSIRLDIILDELESNDFFGTEGQLDPRGDQRDGNYTMDHVQGVDD